MLPDWRFGQFMVNALSEMGRDPFFPEEEEMIAYLEEYASRNSPYSVHNQEFKHD